MWFLVIKQLMSRKGQTILTLVAVILGAAGYIIFSSIQLGSEEKFKNDLVDSNGHISIMVRNDIISAETVRSYFFGDSAIHWINTPIGNRTNATLSMPSQWYARLEVNPEVEAYSPVCSGTAIVRNNQTERSISVVGIDPDKHIRATNLGTYLTSGSFANLDKGNSLGITGERLLDMLGVRVNDTIKVISSTGQVYPIKIIGTINSGDRRMDENNIYTSLTTARMISNTPGKVSKIIVRLKDINRSTPLAEEWRSQSRDNVESWEELSANFMSAIKTQAVVRNITITILILVIAFGIYNILNMVVNHKKNEIAILRSIGYNQHDVVQIFLLQGIVISVIGALAGIIIGAGVCYYIQTARIPVGRGVMLVSWSPLIYLKSFVIVNTATIIASYFPAKAAGRLSPIEIIRGVH